MAWINLIVDLKEEVWMYLGAKCFENLKLL
jgi:hypothetical protein